MVDFIVNILQIVLAVLLVIIIILQPKGAGLGSSFGGSGHYHSKRGLDKIFSKATIVIAAAFLLLSIVRMVIIR